MIFLDGTVYEGQFTEGVYRGLGRLTSANGDVYEGEFIPFVTQESVIRRVQSAKNRSLQSGVVSLDTTYFAVIDFWQLSIPSNNRFLIHERYKNGLPYYANEDDFLNIPKYSPAA